MVFKKLYLKVFLLTLIFISLCTSGYIAYKRHIFENSNRTVEMVLSIRELNRLALIGGVERSKLISRLKKEVGISSFSLEEDTLATFEQQGKITLLKGSEISDMKRIGQTLYRHSLFNYLIKNVKIKPEGFYIFVDENELYERIKNYLILAVGISNIQEIGWNIIEVMDDEEDLMNIGFGIDENLATNLNGYGIMVIPRYKNSSRLSDSIIKLKLSSLNRVENVKTIIFDGDTVLGYPSELNTVVDRFRKNGLNFGYLEFSKQVGAKKLATQIPESVIRVHSIPEGEFLFTSRSKAVDRYVRAAKERGVHILFLHPYFSYLGEKDIVEYNMKFFKEIYERLNTNNFKVSTINLLPVSKYYPVKIWQLLLLTLGTVATLILLIDYFIPVNITYVFIFLIFTLLGFYGSYITDYISIWNRVMAIIVAVSFPSLAVIMCFPKKVIKSTYYIRILGSLIYLLILAMISVLGGILIVGLLSDIKYLFGINQFFGVKISFLLPLILVSTFFFLRPHRIKSIFYVFKRVLYAPIRTGVLLAVFLSILFIFIYILRSGNYISSSIPFIESWMRHGLETLFSIRPRTKEFFIGYPMLFFCFLYVDRLLSRNWLWFFNTMGTVALISVINSFSHTHTPVLVSLLRSSYGLLLGIVVALIYATIFYLGRLLFQRIT